MESFEKDIIRQSSMPLEDGGDTHFHPWSDGNGFTVTTRLPGGDAFYENFEIDSFNQ
ncbi:MAG: hypothetical protein U5O15_08295 [Candidatus Krumholzibacteriota bacterium]|nr:hypothetical protein [Candidatus Krumholzibacteriota bacterium]